MVVQVERFLFRKIELWVVLLLAVFALVGMVLFGAITRNVALGYDRFGRLGRIIYALASLPADARRELGYLRDSWMSVPDSSRFEGRSGWRFADDSARRPDGYILYSRYDGDVRRHVYELVDLKAGAVVHRIVLDPASLLGDWQPRQENDIASPWIPARFRGVHPIDLPGGDLMFKDHYAPLIRMNPCGDLVWRQEAREFHHSLEPGPDGTYWAPTRIPIDAFGGMGGKIWNMGLARFDAAGRLLYERSIGDLLIEKGYEYLVVDESAFDKNPMHLNDVQPVLSDGPWWKRGDVLLSLRNLSAIMLFRPATDEIVWIRRGPWRGQHDVDIVDENTIAIFNNDSIDTGDGVKVRGANKITFYDLRSGETSGPFDAALARQQVRTTYGGLFTLLPGGRLMVEETTEGRLLVLDAAGEVLAEAVNRARDGRIYYLGWSRYLDRARGDRLRAAWAAADCDG